MSAPPQLAASEFGSPLQLIQAFADRLEAELVAAILAFPRLPEDILRTFQSNAGHVSAHLTATATISCAAILAFATVAHLLRDRRQAAARERLPFIGMLKLMGWDLLPLIAAIVVARLLLVRWFGFAPGEATFPVDLAGGMIRWLATLTLMGVIFRPNISSLRLIALEDEGAQKAVWYGSAILAVGHLHALALEAAGRNGLPLDSVKLLTFTISSAMLAGTFRLFHVLRQHGLRPELYLFGIWLALLTLLLWTWGWIADDFDLYRGIKGTIAATFVTLVFDRSLALSIALSRRPATMRLLFVLRVAIDSIAIAVMLRVIAEYWLVGTFGFVAPADWPHFSRRLTFASVVLVVAAWLGAATHVWIEAQMTPPEALEAAAARETRQARLSTVLPVVRFTVLALIACVFSLIALSALGIDITPVMAGAGILGLAISLGSQALVKDIINGIFCMLDDVFRLGEMIEIGDVRGRVEQIKLRSLRLRDDDDRLHTIPFGEIATVASYSRRLSSVTATVPVARLPNRADQERFSRLAAATIRSEPVIQAALIGKISTTAMNDEQEPGGRLLLSFYMSRPVALHSEALIASLVEEAIGDAGLDKLLTGKVNVLVSDVREANGSVPVPSPRASTP